MPVRIRFRNDSAFKADDTAARARGDKLLWHHLEELDTEPVPPAEPGDCWRVRWGLSVEQTAAGMTEGPIAGYEITCIKCKRNHAWTTSTNCSTIKDRPWSYVDADGVTQSGVAKVCDHSGVGSCWVWTGSPEAGDLTASPSLWCREDLGGCGYHGFLQNGVLSDG
jgi:hypothetical protein